MGCAKICVEVSMMSSHLALPLHGHLDEVLHIFAYMKIHVNSDMVYEPSRIEFDRYDFPRKDWSYYIYTQDGCELSENILPNMPKPCRKGIVMMVYFDNEHAGDNVTRRSRTGFVIFLNSAPIYWRPKKQILCKRSSFGSEFCAMRQATEFIRGFCYKLWMMFMVTISQC